MRNFQRVLSGIAGFGIIAASTFPAGATLLRLSPNVRPVPARPVVASVIRGVGPAQDIGRRGASESMTATILLRYNHEAELDALVESQGDRTSPLYGHFLTSAQFDNYFAPTPQQHGMVISALRAAGFTITGSFPNRTVIDVRGSTAAAERFFGTEIHTVVQGSYGRRFTNVRPASIAADLAPFVRSVVLSNLVTKRAPDVRAPRAFGNNVVMARPATESLAPRTAIVPGRFTIGPAIEDSLPGRRRAVTTATTNLIADPGFESGGFNGGWHQCSSSTVSPASQIQTAVADGGKYAALSGPASTTEQRGFAGICQTVTIPSNGILSADLHQVSNEKDTSYAAQDVFLINPTGFVGAILAETVNNKPSFQSYSWNLKNFAGQRLAIYFGVHGDGAASFATKQYVDNVSLVSGTAAPSVPVPVENISTTPCKGSAENGRSRRPMAMAGRGFSPRRSQRHSIFRYNTVAMVPAKRQRS